MSVCVGESSATWMLHSVFEFLSTSEQSLVGRVNSEWQEASKTACCEFIDTVGWGGLGIDRTMRLLHQNAASLKNIRVSVMRGEIDQFVSLFVKMLPSLTSLRSLTIMEAVDEYGTVIFPLREIRALELARAEVGEREGSEDCEGSVTNLILQFSPGIPCIRGLIDLLTGGNGYQSSGLCSIAFLRNSAQYFTSTEQLVEFVKCHPQLQILHLGDCAPSVDMDPVVPLLVERRFKYLQWRNANVSIESMKLALRNVHHCDIDAAAISFLFGLF